MKNVIFTTMILLIAGFPFSSLGIHPISSKKIIDHSVVFPKQRKPNFIQRILLKKIQRKIDRKARKRNKQKENKTDKNANLSFFFGLLTVLAIILGYVGITSATTLGPALMGFIIYGFFALVFGIISLINAVKYFQKNNPSGEVNFKDFKAWFGIGVASILALILLMLLFSS